MSISESPQRPTDRSFLMLLAFWCCLCGAAVLFASVTLAPKLVLWHELEIETLDQQQQLVQLERQVQHLDKVVFSLEHDRRFQSELAQREMGRSPSGEELISVDPSLRVDMRLPEIESPNVPLVVPWYVPILRALATPTDWRRRLLWGAAGLCVLAFAGLCERRAEDLDRTPN